MDLYHYFDKNYKPFMNLSDIPIEQAKAIIAQRKITNPNSFCAKRQDDYMENRLYYESILRNKFLKKGGKIERISPHYMVIEKCDWLASWYENSAFIRIPIEEFDLSTLSFTYGDSHPTFISRINDGKEYRKRLYLYDEILGIIKKYGLPQEWNKDGEFGPERYIEVHIWSDKTIKHYL